MERREVVFVDGVRTAFGRAGPQGIFWRTRADDMAAKVVRELMRRNPKIPPERIGDVIYAATAQVGDQGLTLGRDVALLAGIPQSVPGFAVDRMCAGALTAVTAGAGEIAYGACDIVLAGGGVTAGNSAGLTDGASACFLAAEDSAVELGLEPKMRLLAFGFAGVEPELMGIGPIPATRRVLQQTSLTLDDIGLFELNEPF